MQCSQLFFSEVCLLSISSLVFIPILGWLVSLALSIIAFVLWLVLMWRAYNGEEYEVPYIGKIAREQMGKV